MKLRFIVLFLLLFSCIFFTSCSFAYTWNDFVEFTRQNTTNSSTPGNIKTASQKFIGNLSLIESHISSAGINLQNYSYFYATYSSSYPGSIDMFVFNGNGAFTYTSSQMQLTNLNGYGFRIYNLNSNGYTIQNKETLNNSTKINNKSDRVSSTWGLIYDSSNYGNYWFNSQYVPPYTGPEFEIANNGKINVYYQNNLIENANRLPFGYVFPDQATLGYITNYDDNFYGFEGRFGPLVGYDSDNNMITDSTFASFNYTSFYGLNKNNLDFDFSTGRVSVKNVSLIPNQLYYLTLFYKETYDSDWVEMTDVFIPYYAYFYNNVPLSGDAISSDLNSSVDIGFINAFNDITNNNDNSNVPYLINSFFGFSGDSGDTIFGQFIDYDKNNYDIFGYFYNLFNQFVNSIIDDQNVSLSFGSIVINSSTFDILPISFKNFLSFIVNAILIILILKQLFQIYKKLSTFDLDHIIAILEYDPTTLF